MFLRHLSFTSFVHITGASLLWDSKVTTTLDSAIMPQFLSCSYHVKDNGHYKDKHNNTEGLLKENENLLISL